MNEVKKSKVIAGFGRQTEDGGFFRDKRIYEGDTATTTTTTSSEMPYYSLGLRIRKLTPIECFRLMGVSDEDIAKLHGISDSTKYHLAGDSIVTTCLMAIFGEMLGIDWKEKVRGLTNGWNKGTEE